MTIFCQKFFDIVIFMIALADSIGTTKRLGPNRALLTDYMLLYLRFRNPAGETPVLHLNC